MEESTKRDHTILHVDDDVQVTRLVAAELKKRGYRVESLNDPLQAVSHLVRTQHRVVLLDVDMPGKDGLTLLREIKQLDGGIQVVMLTGLASMSTILQALRWGAEACFFKPITDFEPLAEALEDTFRKDDRWWSALADLKQRKQEMTAVTASQ